ncbi:MAG: BMC domain-containing protein [Lachnospiraceae bacterium]|nr:BMC domain-containing protein [Lachnospiraceae bacterium]MDY5497090.1 BMC domain-containing protein [Anaerobutyricum sp.]
MRRRMDAHVVMEKIVPRINKEYRKLYKIPENHESLAIFSSDCEDVMWMAVDDATKKAKIKVVQIETVYGGNAYSWSRYGGEITAVISGENVSDVKSGLMYAKDYIENKSGNYHLNEEGSLGYYVDYVPRIGKYFQESLGLPEGTSIAYLVASPIDSTFGLDRALKAGSVKIAQLFDAPSRVNTGGAIVYGTESACRAAMNAFVEGVEYCAQHPMDME